MITRLGRNGSSHVGAVAVAASEGFAPRAYWQSTDYYIDEQSIREEFVGSRVVGLRRRTGR